jgi:Lectin C-type domain
MKTIFTVSSTVIVFFVACFPSVASIIAGPIANPNDGCDYYLLSPNSWTASEAEAENLGGTLAIITNSAEQKWVYSKFSSYGGGDRILWLGLHRQYPGGPFAWINGEPTNYANWCPGQPDNGGGGGEDCAVMWSPSDPQTAGTWNDERDSERNYGVAEVLREQSLSESEKSLIGTWYEGGKIDRPCYFTGTTNALFAIGSYGRSARIIYASASHIFAASWHTRGEISQDKILWSDGTWWSKKASNYTDGETTFSEIRTR